MRKAAGGGSVRGADFGEETLERRTEVPTDKEGLDHVNSPHRERGCLRQAPPTSLGLMDGVEIQLS